MRIFDEINNKVNIREVLGMYNIYPTRGNNIYKCVCHADNHPSANVIKNGNKFHCFSCGVTMDCLDLVQFMEKCDIKTAVKILDNKFKLHLFRQLTKEEKKELEILTKAREKEKAEKEYWERVENETLIKIAEQLRIWEQGQRDCHLTKGEYKCCEWKYEHLFFTALKKQEQLNWLYDTICGKELDECEFTYIYGTDKNKILQMIQKGEIVV